jgi:hypothetical protein
MEIGNNVAKEIIASLQRTRERPGLTMDQIAAEV